MALVTFSGLASGIDSAALIEALLDQQREARIEPLETRIATLEDTNSSLDELSTLLTNLQTAASNFRVVNGGAISKQGSSSDESVATAVASNNAATGTYNITVGQLASNATFSFDDRYNSSTEVINSGINDGAAEADRTVSFTIGTGADQENVDVVLTSSTNVSEFVNNFNSQSSLATAAVVNVGTDSSPSYAIMITSDNEGTEQGTITLNSVGSEIGPSFSANTLDQATDAQLSIDGISGNISRSSNTINDLISGVSLNLESTGSATISVGVDSAETEERLQEFVDVYNEIFEYISENDAVVSEDDGTETINIFGPLAETSLDDSVLSAIRQAFTDAGLEGNTVNILADLGVTTQRDGTLAFDTDTFRSALSSDPDSAATILENMSETLAAVDGTIAQYIRFGGLFDEATNANESQISSLQDRISVLEKSLTKQEDSLNARFARLESLIGSLQSEQNALSSLIQQ